MTTKVDCEHRVSNAVQPNRVAIKASSRAIDPVEEQDRWTIRASPRPIARFQPNAVRGDQLYNTSRGIRRRDRCCVRFGSNRAEDPSSRRCKEEYRNDYEEAATKLHRPLMHE